MSNTQVISFKTPGPTNGGYPVPTHGTEVRTRIPKKPMSAAKMIARLEAALEGLERTNCTFWACEGPDRPRHMVTCCRCWAVRDLRLVLKHLRVAKQQGATRGS